MNGLEYDISINTFASLSSLLTSISWLNYLFSLTLALLGSVVGKICYIRIAGRSFDLVTSGLVTKPNCSQVTLSTFWDIQLRLLKHKWAITDAFYHMNLFFGTDGSWCGGN